MSNHTPTTRINDVQTWIQDQKPNTEKKQSVITVIGQTKDQDTARLNINNFKILKTKLILYLIKYKLLNG